MFANFCNQPTQLTKSRMVVAFEFHAAPTPTPITKLGKYLLTHTKIYLYIYFFYTYGFIYDLAYFFDFCWPSLVHSAEDAGEVADKLGGLVKAAGALKDFTDPATVTKVGGVLAIHPKKE